MPEGTIRRSRCAGVGAGQAKKANGSPIVSGYLLDHGDFFWCMIGVSFDQLVSDLEAPLVCAFRVAYKLETSLNCPADGFQILHHAYKRLSSRRTKASSPDGQTHQPPLGITGPGTAFEELLRDCALQMVKTESDPQAAAETTSLSEAISRRAFSLFLETLSTCRPRCFAVEWLLEHSQLPQADRVVLIGLDAGLITTVVAGWAEQLKADGFDAEAEYLTSIDAISWGDIFEEGRPLELPIPKIYIPSMELAKPETEGAVNTEVACGGDKSSLLMELLKKRHITCCQISRLAPQPQSDENSVARTQTESQHYKVFPSSRRCRRLKTLSIWRQFMPVDASSTLIYGNIVHGFNRGSRQLGIPTANIDASITFGESRQGAEGHRFLIPGVYTGWCVVNLKGHAHIIYGCVLNAGFCPHFGNESPSLEAHVFGSELPEAFYGIRMAVDVTSFMRAEGKFTDFSELVDAIQTDCESCDELWTPWDGRSKADILKEASEGVAGRLKRRGPCAELMAVAAGSWPPATAAAVVEEEKI